jgi:hypothetical protein
VCGGEGGEGEGRNTRTSLFYSYIYAHAFFFFFSQIRQDVINSDKDTLSGKLFSRARSQYSRRQ